MKRKGRRLFWPGCPSQHEPARLQGFQDPLGSEACSSNTVTCSNTSLSPPLPPPSLHWHPTKLSSSSANSADSSTILASAARVDTRMVWTAMYRGRILRRAAPRRRAPSPQAQKEWPCRHEPARGLPAGPGPRCCPQLTLAAACASGPAIAPCPERAPARQAASALALLGPGPPRPAPHATAGRGRLAPWARPVSR